MKLLPLPPLSVISEHLELKGCDLVWKKSHCGRKGRVAGEICDWGYRRIRLQGKLYYAHRLSWKLRYGEDPKSELDHLNGNKLDNRPENLEVVTPRENCARRSMSTKKSGLPTGVKRNGNGFCATAWRGSKYLYFGQFSTPEEASEARRRGLESIL